ncbi:MAG: glutamine synthetase III, partial [Fibrobacteraceae bacterium]|nr:glutamine synthetase III [Fibrobacteraceae bacterium]
MVNVPEIFGSMVFNQSVMKEMLPEETYNALKNTMEDGTPLDLDAANQI